jgi:hypothetical protein
LVRQLIEDESGNQTTLNPAQQLSKYIKDSWAISVPSVANSIWDAYWMGKGLMTIYFREYTTKPEPMVLGWGKWTYKSEIGIILSAWYEKNGDYSTVITNARNHIEELIHDDVRAMKDYGISAMHIIDFYEDVDYPMSEEYKDSTCTLEIKVELIASKTVREV